MHDALADVLRVERGFAGVAPVGLQRAPLRGRHHRLRAACSVLARVRHRAGATRREGRAYVDLRAGDVVRAAVEERRLREPEHSVLARGVRIGEGPGRVRRDRAVVDDTPCRKGKA